jgi:N-acetylglucosamine kinase-like BadF-type ATPase
VIGVDGGGTKTTGVLLVQGSRRILAQARRGSTNFHAVGETAAAACLTGLIETLIDMAGVDHAYVCAVGLGMSGVSTDADRRLVQGWVAAVLPDIPAIVENDAVVALAAATDGELFGLTIVSGTGMIVLGVNGAGQRQTAGGWGPLIGEPGGGFALGAAVLKAVADAEDGVGAPTRLTPTLLNHLGLSEPREMIEWVYRDYTWARFATLAPLVVQCAQQGDAVSNQILDAAAGAILYAAQAVARRLGLEGALFPCVFAGGNLTPGPLADRLAAGLKTHLPTAQVTRMHTTPALGAALLAIAGIKHNG